MNPTDDRLPENGASARELAERQRRLSRLSLVLYPDPVLRSVCQPVETFDSTLRDFVREMFELMQAHGGIGLAGPQVALEQRLLIAAIEEKHLCLTNPEIQDESEPGEFIEGCLSLPDVRVKVLRPERIRVTGYDQGGRKISFGATGLWARVIQHELDHLNGILICDRGRPLGEECVQCPLRLPAVLVEERKRRSHPFARHTNPPARKRQAKPHGGPMTDVL